MQPAEIKMEGVAGAYPEVHSADQMLNAKCNYFFTAVELHQGTLF